MLGFKPNRDISKVQQDKLENLEGDLGFRIKKDRLGIIQKSIQCATLIDGVTTTLRLAGMPAGSPQNMDFFPSGTNTMIISSSSTADTLAGTGVQKIHIEGLDINFITQSEIVDMVGQTGATTSLSYFRVQKIQSVQVGSSGSNTGDIYVSQTGNSTLTAGVPADGEIVRGMFAITNFDTYGIFTVPAGFDFHYQLLNSYSDATQAKPILLIQESIIPSITIGQRIRYKVGDLFQTGDVSWNAKGSLQEFEKTDMIFSVRTITGVATLNYYNEYSMIPFILKSTHG